MNTPVMPDMKKMPINMKDIEYCPDCYTNGYGMRRLVFGMQSDGEFPGNKPQKRARFILTRPIIATKACQTLECGYWWPAFSFTPQQIAEAAK